MIVSTFPGQPMSRTRLIPEFIAFFLVNVVPGASLLLAAWPLWRATT